MNLSLGLFLGARAAASAPSNPTLDPASLAATALWQVPTYSGSPYAGKASAGTSGSRTLTSASAPAVGGGADLLNGYAVMKCNGTSQILTPDGTAANLVSDSAFTWIMLVKPASLPAPLGGILGDACLWSDHAGVAGCVATTDGFGFYLQTSSGFKTTFTTATSGVWQAVVGRYNGTIIEVGTNGAPTSSTGAPTPQSFDSSRVIDFFRNYNGTTFFNGNCAEIFFINQTLTNSQCTQIVEYMRSTFALAL